MTRRLRPRHSSIMIRQSMLEAALAYARRGWHVFPLQAHGKRPLIPKTAGGQGYLDATADLAQVTIWWREHPNANIGIACGASHLVVIDLDVKHKGIQSWKQLCAEIDIPPESAIMVKTGGGGAHVYFRPPDDTELHNSAGRLGEGIDVRAVGGYVVAPPSVHPSGKPYVWLKGREGWTADAPDLPDPLVTRMLSPTPTDPSRAEPLGDTIPDGERNVDLCSLAGTLRRRGLTQDEILVTLMAVNERAVPPLPVGEVETIARSVGSYPAEMNLHLTDLGNALRLTERFGDDIAYVHPWGEWLVWSGQRWQRDQTGQIMVLAKQTVLAMYPILSGVADATSRKALANFIRKSESRGSLNSMCELAQSEPSVSCMPDVWDRDAWLLNTLTGTLDLRTGVLRDHRREDKLTKIAPVAYSPDALCPQWMEFLNLVMDSNEDLIAYLQRAVGYALTGSCREQVFFILYGGGANGKSTFTETLARMMGDYAQQVPTTTLMVNRPGSGDPPRGDLARLRGVRLATAIETEAGHSLAEALVKQMTGGDRIVARFPFGRHFEFVPTHKAFLATNNRPAIKGQDLAIWRRIHLIPFEVTIPEEQQIKDFAAQYLHPELPGIMRWAVEGCLAWQEQGLRKPDEVSIATQEYRQDMNPLAAFVSEICEPGEDLEVKGSTLWQEYHDWCEENHERRVSRRAWSMALAELGYPSEHKRDGAWHKGLAVASGGSSLAGFRDQMESLVGGSNSET